MTREEDTTVLPKQGWLKKREIKGIGVNNVQEFEDWVAGLDV